MNINQGEIYGKQTACKFVMYNVLKVCKVKGISEEVVTLQNIDNHAVYKGEVKNPVFISAEPGDVVLFSSFMLHSTTPNITQESRWAYVIEYMQMDKMDPFIEAPYLVVAKDGQSHLEYLDVLPSSKNIINRLKYSNLKQKIKSALFPA